MISSTSIRLMLAIKDTLLRTGIISLLKNNHEVYVVSEASTGIDAVEKYFEFFPDVILSDFSLPRLSGIDAIQRIREKDKSVKSIFISQNFNEEHIYHIIKVGGYGLLHTNITIGEVIYALKEVNKGKRYFGKPYCENKLSQIFASYETNRKINLLVRPEEMKKREISILELISEGMTSQKIATKLNISKRTVDTYRSNIMQRFNLKTLPELIKFAIKCTTQESFVK